MKLIIDVNETYFKQLRTELKNNPEYPNLDYCQIIIASGTPVSNKGDLISRSELKSVLKNECFWCANRDEPCDKSCWRCINEKIDNAPTINTEDCEGCPYCPNSNSRIPIGVE